MQQVRVAPPGLQNVGGMHGLDWQTRGVHLQGDLRRWQPAGGKDPEPSVPPCREQQLPVCLWEGAGCAPRPDCPPPVSPAPPPGCGQARLGPKSE